MRVHQPGSHLSRGRSAEVDDWSWRRTRRRLGTLYRLARPYKARTALALVSLLGVTAASLLPPYLVGRTVDEVQKGNTSELIWLVSAFLAAGVLGVVLGYVQTYFTGWTGERMLADLRELVFGHLQRLSLGFFERNRAGVIISRLTNDVEALDQLVTDGVTSLVQNTLILVGSAVVLFILDWRLALATLVVIPAMGLATAWFRKRSGRAYRAVRETLGAVTATLAEDIAGMRVLQSFTRERAAQDNFREVADAYRISNMQTVTLNGVYFPVVDFLSTIATATVLGYGGWLASNGDVSIGTLVAFLGYLTNFFDPVQQLSQLYNTFLSAVAALDKITDLLDEEPEVLDRPEAVELPSIHGDVSFQNVHFAYGRGPEVLHGIDLDVTAGTTVALVGHTGAGKSTIAKLLARFYDPTEGQIAIDGVDLRDVRQHSLRRQLGIVPQEGFLFAGSVADNVAFARPGRLARGDRRRHHRGRCRRVRVTARGRLRHAARRTRLAALARAAPAGRVRARAARRSRDPDPRRGDELRRHRHRTDDRACASPPAARPHRFHHRAPAVDDPRRRPDRRARERAGGRAGDARRAARRRRWALPVALRRLGRGRLAGPEVHRHRAGRLVVPRLLLGIPEHPQVAEEEDDEGHDRDEPANEGAAVADRLAEVVAYVDDADAEGGVSGRLPSAAVEVREVGQRDEQAEQLSVRCRARAAGSCRRRRSPTRR